MIRFILAFVIIFMLVFFGIEAFRKMTNKDRWQFTKTAFYGIILSMITIMIMTTFVILF